MPSKLNPANLPESVRIFQDLPDDAIIRPRASAILLGYSIATYWREVKKKKIRHIKLSERTGGSTAGDIRAQLGSKAA